MLDKWEQEQYSIVDTSDLSGIHNFFSRWDEAIADIQWKEKEAVKSLLQGPTISVKPGEIFFQSDIGLLNLEFNMYIHIQGKSQKIGTIKANIVSPTRYNATFTGMDEIGWYGVQKKFENSNWSHMEADIKAWLLKELSKKYPEDYKLPDIKTEKEEQATVEIPELGIKYTIFSWLESDEKVHSLNASIEGEYFHFSNFWFQESKWRFRVWIRTKNLTSNLIKNKLLNATHAENIDLKTAVNAMLRNIRRILKTQDKKLQDIKNEILKYKTETQEI